MISQPKENCDISSIRRALNVLARPLTLSIVGEIVRGTNRFGDLAAQLNTAHEALGECLEMLVGQGVLDRTKLTEGEPTEDRYDLTDAGQTLVPILRQLNAWGGRYRDRSSPDHE